MQDQHFIDYLKDEVVRHTSLIVKGEKMIKDGEMHVNLMLELSCYRRMNALLLNALGKLGVSEEEREQLISPIKEN